jgi:hypothetical protein
LCAVVAVAEVDILRLPVMTEVIPAEQVEAALVVKLISHYQAAPETQTPAVVVAVALTMDIMGVAVARELW